MWFSHTKSKIDEEIFTFFTDVVDHMGENDTQAAQLLASQVYEPFRRENIGPIINSRCQIL